MTVRKTLKKWTYRYLPGFAGRFPYYGTRVSFPRNAFIFDLVCEEGIYESLLLRQILGVIKPGTWYFDVGANIGLMSIPVLDGMPDVRVLSFEPSPNSNSFLQKTWEQSPWRDRWTIVKAAAGSQVGETEFCISESRYAGYDGLRHTNRVNKAGIVRVPMTTLDEQWKALGCPAVSCIKMDIEGAESQALGGAGELIERNKPYIFLEWYQENLEPFGCPADFVLKFAEEFGYETVAVPTLSPITSLPILLMQMRTTSAFVLVPKSSISDVKTHRLQMGR